MAGLVKDSQRDDKVLNMTEMETAQMARSFSSFMIVVADWQ